MRIVISLLNEPQLLPLALVEPGLDTVGLLELLQRQDQQLLCRACRRGVGRGWAGSAATRASGRRWCRCHGLFGGAVGPVLQVVVLLLLLRLQVQPGHLGNIRRDQKRFFILKG